jgi:hypothetical protein
MNLLRRPGAISQGVRRCLIFGYRWLSQVFDPVRIFGSPRGFLAYFRDWNEYRRLPDAESIRLVDMHPEVHDRTPKTPVDSHYFHSSVWAMRHVASRRPAVHVDVASHHLLVGLMGTITNVVFVEFRPPEVHTQGVQAIAGDITRLPFFDNSIDSLSCLHAAEHVGLGRYGDPLNPLGTTVAAYELSRVLRPNGELLFVVPVGRPRLCFNAHRIYSPRDVPKLLFPALRLLEFSGVLDDGRYVQDAQFDLFDDADYACGLFRFSK